MRQRSNARTKEREDDMLPAVHGPRERLSADHMISQRETIGTLEHGVSFTIRDEWSGMGVANNRKARSSNTNRLDLKNFAGRLGTSRPSILVKSDAAKEITNAVESLGWFSEPSLQNRWPHNARHERWLGTLKSVIRAAVLQAGWPEKIVDWSVPYSAIALGLKQPCPILDHEKDASGAILAAYSNKANWTCWEAFHKGEKFTGKRPLFGQLIYYLDDRAHTLMPRTSAGLFLGWRMESGLR